MTSALSGPGWSPADAAGHVSGELLASYSAGQVSGAVVWSVEAHLTGCARCLAELSVHADPARLARNRSVLLVRAALPRGGRTRRLLCRFGIPDDLLRLLAATPSLRRSWLLSVACVLTVVAGEAGAVAYGWLGKGTATPLDHARPQPEVLAAFLLVAPLLVLAGVAAAFLPVFDPAARLAVAAPLSGVRLLLVRSVSALGAALIPVVAVAFAIPGPGWLPAALLLPSLALCAFALAAATALNPGAAAITAAVLWALPALLLTAAHVPLLIVQRNAQFACAALLCVSAVVLLVRHDRVEMGWTR